MTAVRETEEEVGLNLSQRGVEYLGVFVCLLAASLRLALDTCTTFFVQFLFSVFCFFFVLCACFVLLRCAGRLDDLAGNASPIAVACFVFHVDTTLVGRMRGNVEVADMLWVPLHHLLRTANHRLATVFWGEWGRGHGEQGKMRVPAIDVYPHPNAALGEAGDAVDVKPVLWGEAMMMMRRRRRRT